MLWQRWVIPHEERYIHISIVVTSQRFEQPVCLLPCLRHSSQFFLDLLEKLLDVVSDVFADHNVLADRPVPQEIAVRVEALRILLPHLVSVFSHVLTGPIQSEDHYVAANRIHLSNSIQHRFVPLTLGYFAVIGQQLDILLHSLALHVLQLTEDVLNLVAINLLIELKSLKQYTCQPGQVIVQVVLALNVLSQSCDLQGKFETSNVACREDCSSVEGAYKCNGFFESDVEAHVDAGLFEWFHRIIGIIINTIHLSTWRANRHKTSTTHLSPIPSPTTHSEARSSNLLGISTEKKC